MTFIDSILGAINRLEHWLERERRLRFLPLKTLGYLLLVIIMLISNLLAVIRWPAAVIGRLLNKSRDRGLKDGGDKQVVVVDEGSLNRLLANRQTVLVDFWAEWCGPCVMMNRSLEQLAERQGDACRVAKVNASSQRQLTRAYSVRGLPTLILFENGKEVKRHAGALSLSELEKFIGRGGAHPGQGNGTT